jgi:hypothetical protein
VTIQSDGSFTETNPAAPFTGCTVSGQIYIIDPNHNLYLYEMNWSNCPSGPEQSGQTVVGVLTLNDAVSPSQLIGGGLSTTLATVTVGQNLSEELNVSFAATKQ